LTVVLSTRKDFTLANYRRVAVGGESVRLSRTAMRGMQAARDSFLALLDSDRTQFIYGTTSGSGITASVSIPPEAQRAHARRRSRSHHGAALGGGYLPDRVVRGILFARLASFIEGNAKVRPAVAEAVASMLDRRLAKVPLDGQVWAGEIVPLAHVMETFPRLDLEEGEGLANGAPCAAALVADVALQAPYRLALAEQVFCLSIEAIKGPLEAYDRALVELWGDPHEAQALKTINRLLAGSPRKGRRFYQAPVSWRIVPRVLGQAHRAVATVEEAATIALPSVSVNPVYEPPSAKHPLGRAFSNGGYHNATAAPAMDVLNASWADLSTLADHHMTKLRRGHVSLLPDGLRFPDDPGLGLGTGMIGMTQVDFLEQGRAAAQRTLIPAAEGDAQNDVATPVFLAYKKSLKAAECVDSVMAMLAVVASQALAVTERDAPPKLRGLLEAVRERCPPIRAGRRRFLGRELARVRDAFAEAALAGRSDLV
jgi:histidine ammonia-lyase